MCALMMFVIYRLSIKHQIIKRKPLERFLQRFLLALYSTIYSAMRTSSILIAATGMRVPGPKIAATPAL